MKILKLFGTRTEGGQKGNYPAALRVTAPLLPSIAVLVTILGYLVSWEVAKLTGGTGATWKVMYGDFAVLGGFLTGLLVWFTVALFQYPYTSAYYVSRRNYNGLKERLDSLKIRVKEGEKSVQAAESENGEGEINVQATEPENGDLQRIRSQALALAKTQCKAIREGLEGRGMPMVTGLGYIELWHRVHRAEEALVKIEPCPEGRCAMSRVSRMPTWRIMRRCASN
jgi:hypothetical protein